MMRPVDTVLCYTIAVGGGELDVSSQAPDFCIVQDTIYYLDYS